MKKSEIVRAWRDPEHFESLSEAERAQVPAHPAGPMEVEDEVLRSIAGGCGPTDPCVTENTTVEGSTAYCTPCPPCWCM